MLDGLLSRGFSAKCKPLMKMIQARIEVIRRKRSATQKFLKKDIADLLANGLDINAYGRADGLLVELDLSACYDFVEKSCELVKKQLSVMQKQSECPEECREAVSSLMHAAARFSDLPELRELRQIFHEKYGRSLDYFENKQFMEKLVSKPSTVERRIKLLESIASEFSVNWDSTGFEQRMAKSSDKDRLKAHGSLNSADDRHMPLNGKSIVPKGDNSEIPSKERRDLSSDNHKFRYCTEGKLTKRNDIDPQPREVYGDGYKALNGRKEISLKDGNGVIFQKRREYTVEKQRSSNVIEDNTPKAVRLGSSSRGKRLDSVDGKYQLCYERENGIPIRDSNMNQPQGELNGSVNSQFKPKSDRTEIALSGNSDGGIRNSVNSLRKSHADETDGRKPFYKNALPPPYVKPNAKLKDCKSGVSIVSVPAIFDGKDISKVSDNSTAAKRLEEFQSDNANREREIVNSLTIDGPSNENLVDATGEPTSRPRSHRKRHSKSRGRKYEVDDHEETTVTRRPRSRRKEDPRRGLQQVLFDDEHCHKDEEERVIDRLLIHYSKKQSAYEQVMVKRRSRTHRTNRIGIETGESQNSRSKPDDELEAVSYPVRSLSLPHEQAASSGGKKTFVRAASFQPDGSNAARHVHPKLPDYDDLASRFAAMKGR